MYPAPPRPWIYRTVGGSGTQAVEEVMGADGKQIWRNEVPTFISGNLFRLVVQSVNAHDALVAAAQAALKYDAAIQRYAVQGKSWVEGDDLDALYADWQDKAHAALAAAGALPTGTEGGGMGE